MNQIRNCLPLGKGILFSGPALDIPFTGPFMNDNWKSMKTITQN